MQRAQRDVKRVMSQMREELLELERLRDSDIRVEFGLSLRIMSVGHAQGEKNWKTVRMPSHDTRSAYPRNVVCVCIICTICTHSR